MYCTVCSARDLVLHQVLWAPANTVEFSVRTNTPDKVTTKIIYLFCKEDCRLTEAELGDWRVRVPNFE